MRSNKVCTLWITDPWDSLDHKADSTLRLMQECAALGIPAYWSTPGLMKTEVKTNLKKHSKISHYKAQNGNLEETKIEMTLKAFEWSNPKNFIQKDLGEFSHVFYRVDPPVDERYLQPLILLQTCASKKTKILNPPAAIFSISEKLGPPELARYLPRTLASSHWGTLHAFGKELGTTIAKPFHQAQSKGVARLEWSTAEQIEDAHQTLSDLTHGFLVPVVLQEYLPAIETQGETRLWFLKSKLLAQVQKRPAQGQFKIDMDHGGTTQLLPKVHPAIKKIVPALGKILKKYQISMAAIDCILSSPSSHDVSRGNSHKDNHKGSRANSLAQKSAMPRAVVTDFNITSPGLLVELERLTSQNLASKILKTLLR